MPVHDLGLLIDCARKAGQIATSFAGQTAKRWDKPGDAGPVTEADLAVNAMMHETLTAARPDYGWLSEESEALSLIQLLMWRRSPPHQSPWLACT